MSRRTRWIAAGVAVLIVLAGAGTAWLVLAARQGDISHPGVEFTATQAPSAVEPPARTRSQQDPVFSWPFYGYDRARTKALELADPAGLHPPYRQVWSMRASVLLEFPPVLASRSGYLLKNNGALYAFSRRTGQVLWKRKLGDLAASSPAAVGGTVYATLLVGDKAKGKGGRVVALDGRDGTIRWARSLPSRTESSPLVDGGRVYLGSEDGTVYALDASDGAIRWRYHAAGAVKGGLAMDGSGNLYFGDYGGTVQSIRAADGSRRWQTGTSGAAFGLRHGTFYGTPAVAYDRVYLGSTDGRMYSFGAQTGRLAWRRDTGAYVYSSPAVSAVSGAPTVYVGSYDGTLYAFDARSGDTRWKRPAGGRISGGITVLGDLVWFSTLEKTTRAVAARTGQTVYETKRGMFNPVVSDGRRIYLVGSTSLFALTPARPTADGPEARRTRGAASSR